MASSINDLPLLALERILLFAGENDLQNWISIFPRVCRQWKCVMRLVWTHVELLHYDAKGQEFAVFVRGPNVFLRLFVENENAVITDAFGYIFVRCPKRMKLELCDCFYSQSLISIHSVLNSELFFDLKRLSLVFFDTFNWSQVQDLSVGFRRLVNLQEIEISVQVLDDVKKVIKLVLYACYALKSVTLKLYDVINVESLHWLEELRDLETFSLNIFVVTVGRDYLWQLVDLLANCSNKLQNVLLNFRSDADLDIASCRNSLLKLATKEINRLHITLPRDGFDQIFLPFAEFKYLKELSLRNVDFSNTFYVILLQHLRLIKFDVDDVNNLDDKFFNAFDVGMQILEEFSIGRYRTGYKVASVDCIVKFLAKCQRLKKFSFYGHMLNTSTRLFFNLFYSRFRCCSYLKDDFVSSVEISLREYDFLAVNELIRQNLRGLKIIKNGEIAKFRFFR